MNIVLSKTMKVVAAGALSVVFLAGSASQSMAADEHMDSFDPDKLVVSGSLTFKGKAMNLIVGGTWGEGILRFKGKEYKFKAKSIGVGYAIGVKTVTANAVVYNLKDIKDFAGTYWGVKAAGTLFYGVGATNVQNSNDVVLNITGASEGIAVDIALGLARFKVELID